MGLSTSQVAEQINRSPDAVLRYEAENGGRPPTAVLEALARLFGVRVDSFFSRHEDGMQDYVDAICEHMEPLTDGEIRAVAAVLRRIDQRQRTAASSPAQPIERDAWHPRNHKQSRTAGNVTSTHASAPILTGSGRRGTGGE